MSELIASTEFSGLSFELWKVYFDDYKPNKGFFFEILALSPDGEEVGYVQYAFEKNRPFLKNGWDYTGQRGIFNDPPSREIEDFCNSVFDDELWAETEAGEETEE